MMIKESSNLYRAQSDVFSAIRFPLIILVVFIHIIPSEFNAISFEEGWDSLYVFVSELVSHYLGVVAVPSFFLISGYLFFAKLSDWSLLFYKKQLVNRWRTLLLPYIIWMVICVLIILAKNHAFSYLGMDKDVFYENMKSRTVWSLFWGDGSSLPLNYPLWYVRDLMVTVVLAPLIYFVLKYARFIGLLFLMVWYVSMKEVGIPGISSTAFLFFGIGAFFSIYSKNILLFSLKYKVWIYVLSVLFLTLSLVFHTTVWGLYFLRFFAIFGVFAFILMIHFIIGYSHNLKNALKNLSGYVFFIYAIHTIYILNWLNGFCSKIPFLNEGVGRTIAYFIIGIVTLLMSLFLAYIIQYYMPKVYAVLTGGRSSKMSKNENIASR